MSTAAQTMQKLPLITLPIGQHQRGLGELVSAGALTRVRLPLAGVDIKAKVADRIATVEVHQRFVNDHTEALECTYVFPLSGGCAVSDFEMRVGTRVIKGVVEERGQARATYQKALNEGKRAALLEQERDDVFTVQVGNIPPGEEVSVVLTYSEKLAFFEDGRTEIMLPLVVAPRYIPGEEEEGPGVGTGTSSDTDVVPDASRITPPRLAKGFDPQTALNIEVEISSAEQLYVEDIACSQHATKMAMSPEAIKVGLARADELLDRDFVLSWRMASTRIVSNLLTFAGEGGQHYGMLSILPPASEVVLTVPRDVIFVLDRSGSMEGEKMVWAARSCANLLSTLRPNDRFAIATFDNTVEWYSPNKIRNGSGYFSYADESGIAKGCDYLRTVTARGGTEMFWALNTAFDEMGARKETDQRIPVVIMLTDGDVGDESRIFGLIQSRIGDARLFTIGVDSAVNTGLLRRVAQLGGGTATFVQPGSQIDEALRSVAREIGPPVLTDITIDDAGKCVDQTTISPKELPDVFAGRAACVFFKVHKHGGIKIKGKLPDGKTFEEKVPATKVKVPAIAQLWAKARIVDLEDTMRLQPNNLQALRNDLIALAIEHRLLSRFTAFVAVDHVEIANQSGKRLEVTQPVQDPDGWADQVDLSSFRGAAPAACFGQAPVPGQARMRSLGKQSLFGMQQASGDADAEWGSVAGTDTGAWGSGWGSTAAPSGPAAPGSANTWGGPPAAGAPPTGGGWILGDPQQEEFDGTITGAPLEEPPALPEREPTSLMGQLARQRGDATKEADTAALENLSHDELQKVFEEDLGTKSEAAPANKPAPAQQQSAPFSGGPGSYGSGVRSQVFEVVVRQAMAGADYRTICDGPMRVNNITPEEIETEVAHRRNRMGKPTPTPPSTTPPKNSAQAASAKGDVAKLPPPVLAFFDALEQAWKDFQDGKAVDAKQLEEARKLALAALSIYKKADKVPKLQTFLRATAVELINSLRAKGATPDNIRPLWQQHQTALSAAHAEATNFSKEKRFWEMFI